MAKRRDREIVAADGRVILPRRLIATRSLSPQERLQMLTERDAWLAERGISDQPFAEFLLLLTASREAHGLVEADPREILRKY